MHHQEAAMAQDTWKWARTIRVKFAVAAAIAISFLVALASWGGVVGRARLPAFWLGVAVLIAVLCGFAFAFWYLLVRPLPASHKAPTAQRIKASYRQAIALLLAIASITIVVGGFWDEVWHRRYGIPFGPDFFWRPHLLMYFGFLSVSALGFAGWYIIARQMQGTFQQRFRAMPIIGLLVLLAAFLVYVLTADPLWHAIYGPDLTAWSIPHVLLIVSFTTIMLIAATIQLSLVPVWEWRRLRRITLYDVLPLLMFACVMLANLQLFTTEYDQIHSVNNRILRARPEWVLPFMIGAVASLSGVLANHSLRAVGAATTAGLLALGLRYALIQTFDAEMLRASAWMLALLPLLAIDLWYGYSVLRKRTPTWIGGGLAGAVGMLVAYPLLTQLYPQLVIANLPVMAVMVLVASVSASWLGAQIGENVANSNKQVEEGGVPVAVPLASVGVLVVLAGFMLFFITTATPPR